MGQGNMRKIGSEGGYDLDELEALKNDFQEKEDSGQNNGEGFMEVDPIYIQVSNNEPVEQKEYEARAVIIEYDIRGNPVSVELL